MNFPTLLGLASLGLCATGLFAANDVSNDLLTLQSAYIPKREVGQPEFLKAHPEWDGRGVVIGIFDTGVDPAAAGLETTTTGDRKILDILDASGSGDVDTSATAKPDDDGTLAGLSGKPLTLPDGIVNPDDEFHLGLKIASEMFPGGALRRLRDHDASLWKAELSRIRAARMLARREADRSFTQKAPVDQTRDEQDEAARESLLQEIEDSYLKDAPEIYYDCVLWNDGQTWRVLVDTDRDGDLADETALRPFRIAGEYGVFDDISNLSFGVQVYEDGNLLSIVTVSGSHGSHVASIAAAHDPEHPERNGIAPGAQIVSIRIGDPRSGGSSTGEGERRAVALAAQAGVDLVNASWGGMSVYQDGQDSNSQAYDMLVERYGILAVVSAGNNGPALSTLGSAGGEASRVLGVGAYVSPEMGKVLYSTLERNAESTLQFSSRGPSKDGDWGVDVIAPGAALASFSSESLQGFEMANGTSMSSPCCAGVAALILSAGKREGLEVDPARVRAAIMLGARWIESEAVYTQGAGLINVSNAWDKLKAIQGEQAFGAFYDLDVSRGSFNPHGRGLYVREPSPDERLRVVVRVEPKWIEAVSADARVAFDAGLKLESSVDWIEVPEFVHLSNAENYFIAHVTVPKAPGKRGSITTGEVRAKLVANQGLGPVFTVPFTIVRGEAVTDRLDEPVKDTIAMKPAHTERLFLNVPEGADRVSVKLKHRAEDPIARRFVLHGVTLAQEVGMYDSGDPEYMRLDEGEERTFLLPTIGGQVMELALYQYWSSVGPSEIEMEFEWHGLGLRGSRAVFAPDQGWADLPLQPLVDETVAVEARIKMAQNIYMPTKTELVPLDERGELPGSPQTPEASRQMRQLQVFEVNFDEATEADLAYPQTYDIGEFFGGGLTEVFHASGERLFVGRPWRDAKIKFPKGKSTFIRYFNQVKGEKLAETAAFPLVLQREVEGSLAVYENLRARYDGKPVKDLELSGRNPMRLMLEDKALKKLAETKPKADVYVGEVIFKDDTDKKMGEAPVVYLAGTPLDKSANQAPKAKDAKDPRDATVKLTDALYESRLAFVRDERGNEDADVQAERSRVLAQLREERPEDPAPVFEEALSLAMNAGLTGKWWKGPKVEEVDTLLATDVVDLLDTAREFAHPEAVAQFVGAKPTTVPGDVEGRQELERKETEVKKTRELLVSIEQLRADLARAVGDLDAAWEARQEVSRWEDKPGERTQAIEAALYEQGGQLGLALKSLNARIKEAPYDRDLLDERIALYRQLDWERFARMEEGKQAIRAVNQAHVKALQ